MLPWKMPCLPSLMSAGLACCFVLLAAPSAGISAPTHGKIPSKTANKKTDLEFDDTIVEGKYAYTDEAVVTVENDNVVDALISVRKDFKGRIKKSASRQRR